MIDFLDPSRWVILRYRPGTGGKFLCACLMTIDRIAHWDRRVEHGELTYQQWVDTQWNHSKNSLWIAFEPLHDWNTTFFSRTFPRGNDITLDQYNQDMNTYASDYLKHLWQSDKLILDFLHKQTFPSWWKESFHITLDARKNCNTHKTFLLSKIFPWDSTTGLGTSMMDKPLVENKYQNAKVFANQFEFGPFDNESQWYDYIWKTDFRLNFEIDQPTLWLDDLLNFSTLEKNIQKIALDLNSSYNPDDLRYVWEVWMNKHSKLVD